jgi:hypothetical protein
MTVLKFHDRSNYRPPPSPEIYSQAALAAGDKGSISFDVTSRGI